MRIITINLLEPRKLTTAIWKFFVKLGNRFVICKLCNKQLRGNETRHLRVRHPAEYTNYQKMRPDVHDGEKDDIEKKPKTDKEKEVVIKEKYKECIKEFEEEYLEITADYLDAMEDFDVRGSKQISMMRKYFKESGNRQVICRFCNKTVQGDKSSHLRTIHPDVFDRNLRMVKSEFDIEETDCDTETDSETNEMDGHKSEKYPKNADDSKGIPQRSVIWNYYDDLGIRRVFCKLCKKRRSYNNMSRHLNVMHPGAFKEVKRQQQKADIQYCS